MSDARRALRGAARRHWSDDPWYQDQDNRDFVPNPGYEIIHEGEAEGNCWGQPRHPGSPVRDPVMPELDGIILLLEDDEEESAVDFDRHLQSLIHQPGFAGVRGIVIGKFQRASQMDLDTMRAIIESKRELERLP